MSQKNISIIGGDLRQVYMTYEFLLKGFFVTVYGLAKEVKDSCCYCASSLEDAISRSDIIIAPIPFTRDEATITAMNPLPDMSIDHLYSCLDSNKLFFAGDLRESVRKVLIQKHIPFFDFMDNNHVAILNAVSTAEGTIMEAIRLSHYNLHNSQCLVLGYGRCAKVLARKLKGLDTKVCIAARKKDCLSYASAYGFDCFPISDLKENIWEFDFIFNTVPARILTKEILLELSEEATIIDIASAPGGVDFLAAKELGINANLCLGLPGKVAPKTSAQILVNTVIDTIDIK